MYRIYWVFFLLFYNQYTALICIQFYTIHSIHCVALYYTFSSALWISSLVAWTKCRELLLEAQAILCMAFITDISGANLAAWSKHKILITQLEINTYMTSHHVFAVVKYYYLHYTITDIFFRSIWCFCYLRCTNLTSSSKFSEYCSLRVAKVLYRPRKCQKLLYDWIILNIETGYWNQQIMPGQPSLYRPSQKRFEIWIFAYYITK